MATTTMDQGAALVTGAGGGIGGVTVTMLAERGWTVYAGVRNEAHGIALARLPRVRPVIFDVTDLESIARVAREVAAERDGAGLQALANVAGLIVQGPVELVPQTELRRQFEANTYGPMSVIQTFLPLLRQGRGRIVNVSSVGAHTVHALAGGYHASKFRSKQ